MNIVGIINIGISSGTLIIIITAIFRLGRWTKELENRICNLENSHTEVRRSLEHQDEVMEKIKIDVEVLKVKQH
jgi:hypothetical protein